MSTNDKDRIKRQKDFNTCKRVEEYPNQLQILIDAEEIKQMYITDEEHREITNKLINQFRIESEKTRDKIDLIKELFKCENNQFGNINYFNAIDCAPHDGKDYKLMWLKRAVELQSLELSALQDNIKKYYYELSKRNN